MPHRKWANVEALVETDMSVKEVVVLTVYKDKASPFRIGEVRIFISK